MSASVKNRSNDIISLKAFAYTISTIDGIIYCKNTKTIIGGSSSPSIVTFEYIDKMGRVVRSGNIHNGNEIYKTFLYDNVGNLISETAENGGTTLYTYNAIGNIITRTDALGNIEEIYIPTQGCLYPIVMPAGTQRCIHMMFSDVLSQRRPRLKDTSPD